MFSPAERDRILARLIRQAEADRRVVAAAVVGSLADGRADQWSDIDLTMAVDESVEREVVLASWSETMAEEFGATVLFDLEAGFLVYRVFMLPDWLQVDLSFGPASQFQRRSERFKPLFGSFEDSPTPPRSAADAFGWAVMYGRTARASIDRGRFWSAEFCINALRYETLAMACSKRGLPSGHGRGLDDLPHEVVDGFEEPIVRSLAPAELCRALRVGLDLLTREAEGVGGAGQAHLLAALPELA